MSEVKVNKISPRTACGTVTLGDSGDTFTVPSGVTISNSGTATGFGRTGTVDWVTTPKVTGDSPVTAATGSGYFLNTTAGAITINLPAGAAGSIVSMADYAATWQTNNVTVAPNGSEKIGAIAADAVLNTEGQSVTFVYVDSTQGWVNTMDSTSNVRGQPPYIVATGGTPCSGAIVCTDYKVHTFTGPGTFCVSNAGGPGGSNTIDYLVVGGGGAGGHNTPADAGGAGGAGGFRASPGTASGCYTASPRGAAPAVALPVTATGYPVVIGAGGTGACNAVGGNGVDTVFTGSSTITAAGGGGGGSPPTPPGNGIDGGSGGGAASGGGRPFTGGAGNTPPTNPVQGMDGGAMPPSISPDQRAGGGGGAITVGSVGSSPAGGPGGDGGGTAINPSPTYGTPGPSAPLRYFAGGGGGSAGAGIPGGTGGDGGGGLGGNTPPSPVQAVAGTVNTGGGSGGGAGGTAVNGGSGIVIIRYKFQ